MRGMATGVLVAVEEYLRTSYRPDCDYVDGEVVERHWGEGKHSDTQREILFVLAGRHPELRKRLRPEQRVQVSPTRFRVPDVCVIAEGTNSERIVITPPVLCIEVLSPEDTVAKTMEKIRDYFKMGVPACWIIDPASRQGWAATPGKLEDAADGILRAGAIELPLAEVIE
jgi:Uma2 family endonuclease